MKLVRYLVAGVLVGAALAALTSQADGGGALLSQTVYLIGLGLFAIDHLVRSRREDAPTGRSAILLGLGFVVAAILFSPDFGQVLSRKAPGISKQQLSQLAESGSPTEQTLALELCLRRRLFTDCKKAFLAASKSESKVIQALGRAGMKGRSGVQKP
ncbi:MAG: hypothetical protein CMH55_04315 [Myxococcales bacterium]|nr:hypothetical protein [Myxococcales bacterium]